jgi:hypothetical protein
MKCPRCGKDNPPSIHTCTAPPAIYLAEQIEAVYEAPLLPRKAAAELRRLHEELEGTAQRNRDIYGQLDKAEAEIDRLYAENEALRKALNALYVTAPYAECSDFHHPKKDRHELGEHCPVLARYEDARLKARAALARAGEKT